MFNHDLYTLEYNQSTPLNFSKPFGTKFCIEGNKDKKVPLMNSCSTGRTLTSTPQLVRFLPPVTTVSIPVVRMFCIPDG